MVRRSHLRGPESCVVASRSSASSFFGRRSRRRSESCDESESDPDPDEPLLRPMVPKANAPSLCRSKSSSACCARCRSISVAARRA